MAVKRERRGRGALATERLTITINQRSTAQERAEAVKALEEMTVWPKLADIVTGYRKYAEAVLQSHGKKFGDVVKRDTDLDEAVTVIAHTFALRDALPSGDIERVANVAMQLEAAWWRLRIRREKMKGPHQQNKIERANAVTLALKYKEEAPAATNEQAAKWITDEASKAGLLIHAHETLKKDIRAIFPPRRGRPKMPRR